MTNPTPNTSARLLSKAERDATRDFYQKTSDTVTGGTLPGPHHRGWNKADLFEWACQLCDTADHWEAEFRILFGVNLELQREVTRLRELLGEIKRATDKVASPDIPSKRLETVRAILAKAAASPGAGP